MPKIIILKGLPASGKSTWAKETIKKHPNQYKRVNKDDLRAMIDAGIWSKDNERQILATRNALIDQFLSEGKNVIVDDTNLNPKHIEDITNLFKVEIEVKFFDVDIDECISRDKKRENPVGEKVIKEMYYRYLRPESPKLKEFTPGLPEAIICDIDGTLAKMTGRSPYDYSQVMTDIPNRDVYRLVKLLAFQGMRIILVSGRDGSCEAETRNWLTLYKIPYHFLYMRPAGNKENDAIIKKNIYDEKIKDQYNIAFVLDDRDRVVNMWRSLGLTCLQVDYGNF